MCLAQVNASPSLTSTTHSDRCMKNALIDSVIDCVLANKSIGELDGAAGSGSSGSSGAGGGAGARYSALSRVATCGQCGLTTQLPRPKLAGYPVPLLRIHPLAALTCSVMRV